MKLIEVKGDLFSCPETYSLAHCISADVKMGKGIAKLFREEFGGVQQIIDQVNAGCGSGDCALLERQDRYIFHLITKHKYYQKPTYDSFRKSLHALRNHCRELDVKYLAMPKIGCGLDGLAWERVRKMIEDAFKDMHIDITVFTI